MFATRPPAFLHFVGGNQSGIEIQVRSALNLSC